ncbi:MAG: patatin-like phospholipase family protein [Bacilli bacterium]|nr:patatin-like phospholipase family protein [Bacilli bacterium]MDD4718315.1 patatin-like phospholipase family protein [Bacilli bacterium]
MKRAIVLSGGGAKGAYQVGVWRALRKLNIKYDIVTGTSVGALNGALMVQNEYIKARSMWYNINFNIIFKEQMDSDLTTFKGRTEILKKYMSNILLHGGMDVSQMELTMDRYINHRKFYKSKIDYGLVTVNLSSFKPVLLKKHEIAPHKLKDYLMASATCFPAFKVKHIDDDLFIDGAYYDKIPINQAIEMGATEIIAVDLNSFGLSKKVKEKSIPITYIIPRNKLDSFLLFDSSFTRRSIKLGYNDAMKTFNQLDGIKYTFKKNNFDKNFSNYFEPFRNLILEMTDINKNGKSITKELLNKRRFSSFINSQLKSSQKTMTETLEYLGERFKLNDSVIYRIDKYNKLLIESINNYDDLNIELIEKKIRDKEIIKLTNKSYFIKYLYNKILIMEDNPRIKRELCNFALLFEKDVLAAIYLYIINSK